jgi:CubicO group peptidase (beta-lactamase class C family)
MRQFFFPYIATILLTLTLFACHSSTEPAQANPRIDNNKVISVPLAYEDTSSPTYKDIIRRLDSFYGIQARHGFNGSVLIGSNGKVIYERYYGYANRGNEQKLTPENAVQLASISKTFTGTAILYLHQNKFLDINERVQTYLHNFPYPDITVKMLLDHRAGLPDYTKWIPAFRKDGKTPITNDMMLNMFATYKPHLEFRPNTRFKYSNSNYAILACIAEKVTDMRFPDFMRKYIFDPLGMQHTFIFSAVNPLPASATISYKYNWVKEPDMFADGIYGDKNVYSTVEDMYRWDQSFYKHTLLKEETVNMAYTPCSFEKRGIKNYGLGWRMLCYPNGNQIIYHNGWWHGNNTSFYRFIHENLTIIILGNKYNTSIYHQAPVLYSIVKGVPVQKGFDTEE